MKIVKATDEKRLKLIEDLYLRAFPKSERKPFSLMVQKQSISFVKALFGIPELISVVLVAVLHVWKRNTLFSIICGTVCYMVLIQFVL